MSNMEEHVLIQIILTCAQHSIACQMLSVIYLQSNMNITERDVELQKEKCQKLTIAKGDN